MKGFDIKKELEKLPARPGVYRMHDATDAIIYVGKAKVLKNRVRQYFTPSYKKSDKITQMVSLIDHFDYIVVDNEVESLILESNMIKEYRPKYNTLLKDDKTFPYIKITTNEDFPRMFTTRRRLKDKARYFGPYVAGADLRDAINILQKTYKIRSCTMPLACGALSKSNKVCLYYHIDKCKGPCVGKQTKEDYDENVKSVIKILEGKTDQIVDDLKGKMMLASDKQEFEKAAKYRDELNGVLALNQRQKMTGSDFDDKDIIGLYKEKENACFQIFIIRDGKIVDRSTHIINVDENDSETEIMGSFLKLYYIDCPFLPNEIWIKEEIEDKEVLEKYFADVQKKKVKFVIPKKGSKDKLLKLAIENARISLKNQAEKHDRDKKIYEDAVKILRDIVGKKSISRIESYDISNTLGSLSVASMVVFIDGIEKKNEYRKFRIKTIEGVNDYGSLCEVLSRRIEAWPDNLPDLFLIDGGRGQVHSALSVLSKYNVNIPVCGMVKNDKHQTRGLYYNDREIDLENIKEYKSLYKFITKIQDETHRFAIEYHRSLRSKSQVHSVLDDIKGLGPKKKQNLMKNFGDIEKIKNASIDELTSIKGIDSNLAKRIKEAIK